MLNKFDRNYELFIQTEQGVDNFIKVTNPMTIEFDIVRNTLGSANRCQIRVYNLAKVLRDQIRFDISNYGVFRGVTLNAGYGNNLTTIFNGNINQAWNVREGVNFITQIECYDGGFAYVNGLTNTQFPAGTPVNSVVSSLQNNLPNVKPGAVGVYPNVLTRGVTYSGNTMKILNQVTGNGAFIDNGTINCLNTNEYLSDNGSIAVINSQAGLLQTPVLEKSIVHFDMIFEPNLRVGQRISLESIGNEAFNGIYKVSGLKHKGMISGAVCGKVITTVEFLILATPG